MSANAGGREPDPPSRHLPWAGCFNVRDLGGLQTTSGGRTRWRSLIRSDTLSRLNAPGQAAVIAYGVRTVIDLRSTQEVLAEPSNFTAQTQSIERLTYLNLPLERHDPEVSRLVQRAQSRAEIYAIMLDHNAPAVSAVLRAIASADSGGLIIHCHAGKDRTGIVAAMLLALADVTVDAIAADYAESQPRLWPHYEQLLATATPEMVQDPWFKPVALAETIHSLFDHLEARYGGVRGYLEWSGLNATEVAALSARLMAPASEG